MLIPDLTLTPGLADRLRVCGDEPLIVRHHPSSTQIVLVQRRDKTELAEHERIRVTGVLAAHREKAF